MYRNGTDSLIRALEKNKAARTSITRRGFVANQASWDTEPASRLCIHTEAATRGKSCGGKCSERSVCASQGVRYESWQRMRCGKRKFEDRLTCTGWSRSEGMENTEAQRCLIKGSTRLSRSHLSLPSGLRKTGSTLIQAHTSANHSTPTNLLISTRCYWSRRRATVLNVFPHSLLCTSCSKINIWSSWNWPN